jgi:hypothetical protein
MQQRSGAAYLTPYAQPQTWQNATTYPPASTSTLSLQSTREQDADTEKAAGVKAKKSWIHKEWDTAFGPLSVKGFLKRKYIKWYLCLVVILVLVALMTIYHDQIVTWSTGLGQNKQRARWSSSKAVRESPFRNSYVDLTARLPSSLLSR